MNSEPISWTFFRSLYDVSNAVRRDQSWSEIVSAFATPHLVGSKLKAPGFGPYTLVTPTYPCVDHGRGVLSGPHRCEVCIDWVTMLVFDADQGTLEQVMSALDKLRADDVTFLAYSTYSHGSRPDGKACFRVVVPLAEPIEPGAYGPVRGAFLCGYRIPAAFSQCGSCSHFYFLPSRFPNTPTPYVFVHHEGKRYVPAKQDYGFEVPGIRDRPYAPMHNWQPPPNDPEGPDPRHVAALRAHMVLAAQADVSARGQMLWGLGRGTALASHGARNETTLRAAGYLTWKYPEYTPDTYLEVLRPCVEAMIAEGSTLTMDTAERMVLSGMRKKWAADNYRAAETEKSIADLEAWVADVKRKANEEYERDQRRKAGVTA